MKFRKFFALVVCLGLLMPGIANAVVNPENFKRGPEVLVLKVTGQSILKRSGVVIVHLLAQVISVERSATNLETGDSILISYESHPKSTGQEIKGLVQKGRQGWAGQQPLYAPHPPELGTVVTAYLQHLGPEQGRAYAPSAHQYSFEARQ